MLGGTLLEPYTNLGLAEEKLHMPDIPSTIPNLADDQEVSNVFNAETYKEFNEFTELLARQFKVPIATISFATSSGIAAKSCYHTSDAPPENCSLPFCKAVIEEQKPVIIQDLQTTNLGELGTKLKNEYGIRFFAGWPITTTNGHTIGSLCIVDTEPRELSRIALQTLNLTSQQILKTLELRKKTIDIQRNEEILKNKTDILQTITEAQESFISGSSTSAIFQNLLDVMLRTTGSEYGFIGEILKHPDQPPYLKTHAITNIAWNDETRKFYEDHKIKGLEFHNLETLFGRVITTMQVVISNDPTNDPRRGGLPSEHPEMRAFLGLPLMKHGEIIGMIGIANRAGGYDQKLINFVTPLLSTTATLIMAHKEALLQKATHETLNETTQNLERINSELQRSNTELSQFAYVASHDMQTPLRHLKTYLEIFHKQLPKALNPQLHQALEVIDSSVDRMQSMITDLLSYASIGHKKLKLKMCNLQKIITENMTFLDEEFKLSKGSIEYINCDAKIPIDVEIMRHVFQNILQNAIKYRDQSRPLNIKIDLKIDDYQAMIKVSDNGKGINREHRDRVFKMFQRLPSDHGNAGSGIGLSICKKGLERHGGIIEIRSNESNEGTQIYMEIPFIELD
jgi:signal transduction histidine kinase